MKIKKSYRFFDFNEMEAGGFGMIWITKNLEGAKISISDFSTIIPVFGPTVVSL